MATEISENGIPKEDETWRLVDPRPIQEENPYTFFVPSEAEKAALVAGDIIKLIFEGPVSNEFFVERMWLKFEGRDAQGCFGYLDNQPYEIEGLHLGDMVRFQNYHIVSVLEPKIDLDASDEDRYFARCYVDPALMDGKQKIGRLERRKPPRRWWRKKRDRFQNTGWYIYAEGTKKPWRRQMQYIAIGHILNKDDSILEHLRLRTHSQ